MRNVRKWFAIAAGGSTGVAGPGDDFFLYTKRGQNYLSKAPNFAIGVKRLAQPVGVIGKLQAANWINRSPRALGGFSDRMLQSISFGHYEAPQSSWDNSPRARFLRPKNIQRNPYQDRWTVHKQDYARRGIVWMP